MPNLIRDACRIDYEEQPLGMVFRQGTKQLALFILLGLSAYRMVRWNARAELANSRDFTALAPVDVAGKQNRCRCVGGAGRASGKTIEIMG